MSDQPLSPSADDVDGDGLGAAEERLHGTNPGEADTDGDGLSDWVESIRGTNPRSSSTTGGPTSDLDDVAADLRAARGRAPGETIAGEHGRHAFLDAARSQLGDPYRFGAEARLDDPDPDAFDSSELVEWAAAQAGITPPDWSWRQYRDLHEGGNAVSVGAALRTPGALVFGFSSDPLASTRRPAQAFVAISLGDGTVIDVSERATEVRVLEAGSGVGVRRRARGCGPRGTSPRCAARRRAHRRGPCLRRACLRGACLRGACLRRARALRFDGADRSRRPRRRRRDDVGA